MAVNDDLADSAVRRAAVLERRINGIWAELLPILRRVERDLIEKIEDGVGPRGGTFRSQRAQRLLIEVRKIIEGGAAEFEKRLVEKGLEAGKVEEVATLRSLETLVPVRVEWVAPAAEALAAIAVTQPFTEDGAILKSFVKGWSESLIEKVQGQIRMGLVEGEGVETIRRRIEADVLEGGTGTLRRARQKARAIVRTYANHVTSVAREEVYKANSDVIEAEVWTATLDDRTCPSCGALDGREFPIGKGPRTPLHAACRCLRRPKIKGRDALIRAGLLSEGSRASIDGPVPANMTFPEWLKRQPAKVQKDVLGKTRADLFREGTKFDKFVSDENEVLTLDELRRVI